MVIILCILFKWISTRGVSYIGSTHSLFAFNQTEITFVTLHFRSVCIVVVVVDFFSSVFLDHISKKRVAMFLLSLFFLFAIQFLTDWNCNSYHIFLSETLHFILLSLMCVSSCMLYVSRAFSTSALARCVAMFSLLCMKMREKKK